MKTQNKNLMFNKSSILELDNLELSNIAGGSLGSLIDLIDAVDNFIDNISKPQL